MSAFGGVIGLNRAIDGAAAEEMAKLFVEVIAAPGFDAAARAPTSPGRGSESAVASFFIRPARAVPALESPDRPMSSRGTGPVPR